MFVVCVSMHCLSVYTYILAVQGSFACMPQWVYVIQLQASLVLYITWSTLDILIDYFIVWA